MAELIANMIRTRVFQFGAAFFCTALLATQVDLTSLTINHNPPQATHSSPPPFHTTTAKPSSTPLICSTHPVKILNYEPTTSFSESSAAKTVYVFDYVPHQPNVQKPRPEASAKPPRRPFETPSIPLSFSPRQTNMTKPLTGNQTPPIKHWKLKGFQNALSQVKHQLLGILTDIRAHIMVNFPGMAPSFGMIAWYQFNYIQNLLTNNRELEELRRWAGMWEANLTRAVEVAEALQKALTVAQQTSREKLREAAKENTRLTYSIKQRDETIAVMSAGSWRLTQEVQNLTKELRDLREEGEQPSKNGTDAAATNETIAELKAQIEKANHERQAADANASRQKTIAKDLGEQLKAAQEKTLLAESKAEASEKKVSRLEARIESLAHTLATNNTAFVEVASKANEAEDNANKTRKVLKEYIAEIVGQHVENQRVKDAEEAARRAKGEASHLVKSQIGQLNKLKATCDSYRERYGKLNDVNALAATTSSVNVLPSAPSINQDYITLLSMNKAMEGKSQSAGGEDGTCKALDVPPSHSSIADDGSDTCPNPGSSLDTRLPGNEQGHVRKRRHRRGARPRSSKNPSQPGDEPPTITSSESKAQREGEIGDGAGGW